MTRQRLAPRKQFKFLPRLTRSGFRQVMRLCDVMLDTLNWSGGNTSLDAIAVGLPIVTLPGAFMRGRQSKAMLETLDLSELVVSSQEDFLSLAAKIAHDHHYREHLRGLMRERADRVFRQSEPISALADMLQKLAAR